VVGHEKARAPRAREQHLVAPREVAEVVRRDAPHGRALAVVGDALHRQREVVVPRALPVARARDGVQPHVVGPALRVDPRRDHADRSAPRAPERPCAEVEDEVPDVGLGPVGVGDAMVAATTARPPGARGDRPHVGVRGAPGRRHAPHARRGRRGDRATISSGTSSRAAVEVGARAGGARPSELLLEVPGARAPGATSRWRPWGRAGRQSPHALQRSKAIDDVVAPSWVIASRGQASSQVLQRMHTSGSMRC
jgi:hypothetical protein